MAKLLLSVPTIHCEGCAQHIRSELGGAPGVTQIEVDIPRKQLLIDYDATTENAIREKLTQIGFAPERTVKLERPPRAPVAREPEQPPPSRALWYWLFVAGVAILALAGYVGYELYPRFKLPPAQGLGLLLLSAGAGIASFFSPCAFPLLVTLLARETGARARTEARAGLARPLAFATALSVGASAFLIMSGILIALGAARLFAGVTFTSIPGMAIRAVVGGFLILLGLVQLGILPNPLHVVNKIARPLMRSQARYRRQSPVLGFTIFGFGYLLAGFGWTGPILAGLAGHAFTIGGFGASLTAFIVAAVVIVLLMFVLSLAIATAQEGLIATLRAHVVEVKRWGGWVLIVVGIWLIVLTVFADFFARIYPV